MHGNEHSNIWVNDGKWRVPDLGKPYALLGGGVSLNSSGHCILHSLFTLLTEGVGPQGKAHHDEQIRKIWNLVERCQQRQPQMLHPAGRVRCCLQVQEETTCFQERAASKKNDPKWIKLHAAFKLRHEAIKHLGIETWLTELFPRRCPKVKWPCDMDLPYWSFQSQLPRPDDRMIENWSVVWNMAFMTFHYIGNFIIPTDELHHFSEG